MCAAAAEGEKAKAMSTPTLQQLTTTELAEAADENFVVHASWAHRHIIEAAIIDDGRLLVADSGLPCDTFNVICRARLTSEEAPARIAATLAHFGQVKRPFSWWVGPVDQPANLGALLVAAGLAEAETELAMAVDLAQLQVANLAPAGLVIRRAQTPTELADFAQVMAANWNPPDPEVLRHYQRAAAPLLSVTSPLWFYVGYLDGKAVAAAELTVGGGVVGLYSICTLVDYRRRGFGMALTLRLLLDARAAGYGVGVLQAGAEGVRIYERIGFQTFGGITEYKPAS
ncbi:MAG: GNAT family N-acetyltransferase [Caldilinea sp. CFX5]|nr:GNAT family N-acetyltransferase [Caldilinea sp. CFX5]